MTDEFPFPALHEPQPGELKRRRDHLLSEITREPAPRSGWRAPVGPLRLRYALPALAVAGAAAASGLIFTGALSGAKPVASGHPPAYEPLKLAFTRDGSGAVTSIAVTAEAATLGGTANVYVVQGQDYSTNDVPVNQVVFQEEVPMTDIASPASGPPGTVALSTWSGVIPTSEWKGGCQSGPYEIALQVSPANPTPPTNGEAALSGSFTCTPRLPLGATTTQPATTAPATTAPTTTQPATTVTTPTTTATPTTTG